MAIPKFGPNQKTKPDDKLVSDDEAKHDILASTKLSDIRVVELFFFDNLRAPQTHIVHKDDIDKFVTATIQLHISPGINPHAPGKGQTSPVHRVEVRELTYTSKYWWATPGLNENGNGARVFDGPSKIWASAERNGFV